MRVAIALALGLAAATVLYLVCRRKTVVETVIEDALVSGVFPTQAQLQPLVVASGLRLQPLLG